MEFLGRAFLKLGPPIVVYPGLVAATKSGDAAIVLSDVLSHLSDPSGKARVVPSVACERTGLTEERLIAALVELQSLGLITFEVSGDNGTTSIVASIHAQELVDGSLDENCGLLFPPPTEALSQQDEPSEFAIFCRLSTGKNKGAVVEWKIPKRIVEEYQAAYPGVDVPAQLRRMRAWGMSNKNKVPTHRGVLRFINSWLASQSDRQAMSAAGGTRQQRFSAPDVPKSKTTKTIFMEE